MDAQALRKRGFVAAPLIGTLIFLAAVLFVVHLNQVEKAEVASIVSNSYHSSITSSLEQYRSDMGTLFAVSLSRAIEKFLAKGAAVSGTKCNAPWDIFRITNKHRPQSLGASGDNTLGFVPPGLESATLGKGAYGFDYDGMSVCNPGSDGKPRNPSPLCKYNGNGQLDYRELRYAECVGVSSTIRAGICAYNPEYGIPAWIKSASEDVSVGSFDYKVSPASKELARDFIDTYNCEWSDGSWPVKGTMFEIQGDITLAGKSNGVPPVLSCLGKSSDGIDCVDSKGNNCNGRSGGTVKLNTQKSQYCNDLVGDSLFDCRNFAENLAAPMRCCEQYFHDESNPTNPNNGKCCDGTISGGGCPVDSTRTPVNKIVAGCEGGSFLVGVNVLANDDVYKRLPRVRVKDKAGNEIQGGAMGESDFKIQVKYPFYKYLDAAFRFYAPFAYGTSGSPDDFYYPEKNLEPLQNTQGVVEGLCYGNNCKDRSSQRIGGIHGDRLTFKKPNLGVSGIPAPGSNPENAKVAAAKQFVKNFFSPTSLNRACRMFQPSMCNPAAGAAGAGMNVCAIKVVPTGDNFISQNELESNPALKAIKENGLCSSDPSTSSAIYASLETYLSNPNNARKIFSGNPLLKAGGGVEAPGTYAFADQLSIDLRFEDPTPETLVEPDANEFCWTLSPEHFNP
ncbi:hypothetical protein HY995_02960 [Candidatus Micrarchaeota archaeon]|nr:hypothetical protein [Candidatus Micrarchaeota archaeon]